MTTTQEYSRILRRDGRELHTTENVLTGTLCF